MTATPRPSAGGACGGAGDGAGSGGGDGAGCSGGRTGCPSFRCAGSAGRRLLTHRSVSVGPRIRSVTSPSRRGSPPVGSWRRRTCPTVRTGASVPSRHPVQRLTVVAGLIGATWLSRSGTRPGDKRDGRSVCESLCVRETATLWLLRGS